jgi:hypothetical protein
MNRIITIKIKASPEDDAVEANIFMDPAEAMEADADSHCMASKPWRLSQKQGLVLVEFEPGTEVSADVVLEVYYELDAEPISYHASNVVWDLRNIVPAPNSGYEKMLELVERFRELRRSWWRYNKTALVVASKVTFGLSRMYASITESIRDCEVQIFNTDLQAAIDWARPTRQFP